MAFWKKAVLGAVAFGAFFAWYAVFRSSGGYLYVTFLNVGEGDAIFIETPEGNQVLVDGGPGRRVLSELGRVMPGYDKSIDLLVSTHTDYDHLSGLVEVLKKYDIGTVVENGLAGDTALFKEWDSLLGEKLIPRKTITAGDRIILGDGVYMDILGPFKDDFIPKPTKANEAMVVSRLVFGDTEFLLPGDLEKGDEIRLANSGLDIKSDVLKISHHGSRNSSTNLFLNKVSPEFVVISVGAHNKYGHPNKETMERIGKLGAAVYRTDTDGRITVRSDGVSFSLSGKKL